MKELFIAIPLLLLLGACGICGNSGSDIASTDQRFQPVETKELAPCNSFECINSSIDTCTPSVFDTEVNKTKLHIEIRGRSSTNECIVYLKVVEVNPEVVPSQYKFALSSINGADGICALTDEDIANIKSGNMDPQYLLSKCEGPLKNLAQMAGQFSK